MMCREVERSSLPSFYGTHLSARRGIYCATLLVIVFKIISPFRFLSLKKQDWNDVFFLENQSTAPLKLSVKTWQWLHVYFLATTTFSSSDFVSDSESEEELLWVRSAGTSLILITECCEKKEFSAKNWSRSTLPSPYSRSPVSVNFEKFRWNMKRLRDSEGAWEKFWAWSP